MSSNMSGIVSALTNNTVVNFYNLVFTDLADPRTNHWFLISSPLPGVAILAVWMYFCLSWGPRYMKNRKPFEIKKTLIVYNFIQVVLSIHMFLEGCNALRRYNLNCEPVDTSESEFAMRVAGGVYLYFASKISELLDTVFFVLRKKDRQITFLHMYHHTVMPMVSWGATKYYPGGHGIMDGILNTFVHIWMYSYYMISAMGPEYQKYLFWKKHITTMQMIQFLLVFLHSSQLLFFDCGYPRWSIYLTMPNAVFFYLLFNNFYRQSYNISELKKPIQNGHPNGSVNRNYNSDTAVINENGMNIVEPNNNDNKPHSKFKKS